MKEDLILAAILMAVLLSFVAAAMLGRSFLNERAGLKLHSKPVLTIPLEEMNKCQEKDGVIVVRDGKWECVGSRP